MANTLQIKRSTTAGNVPQLAAGELGANLSDNTLYVGQDDYTKLLIHGGGVDGTQVFPDASPSGHTISYSGNTQWDDTKSKFASTSIKFDGTGDYLSVASNSDFNVLEEDFTIDGWVNFGAVANLTICDIKGYTDGLSFRLAEPGGAGTIGCYLDSNNHIWTWTPTVNTWYHLALIRSGSTLKCYVDGTALTATSGGNPSGQSIAQGIFQIGKCLTGGTSQDFQGYMDEFRFSKNIARWTAAFTPPTRRYGVMSPEPTGDHLPLSGGTLTGGLTIGGTVKGDGDATRSLGATDKRWGTSYITKLAASDGNESNPSHTFQNDLNTGMWRPNTDIIAFSTNGSERLRIDAATATFNNNLTLPSLSSGDTHTKLLIHSDTHDGSTTFTDSSPSGHAITNYDVVHKTTKSKFGATSLYVAASLDRLFLADSPDWDFGTGDFTIDCWVNPSSGGSTSSSWGGIVTFSPATHQTSYLNNFRLKDTSRKLSLGWNANNVASNTAVPLNTWTHVAVVRSGSTVTFYQNGVADGSHTGQTQSYDSSGHGIEIGSSWVGYSAYYWDGYIDEFRISKTARWTAAFTPPTRAYSYVDLNSNLNVAGYLEAPNIDGKPDKYTKLLIHSDTTDGRGTFTDSSPSGHAISTGGDPTHETEQSKFGASSLYFDGDDSLHLPENTDWDFGTGDFTVDYWIRFNSQSGYATFYDYGYVAGLLLQTTSDFGSLIVYVGSGSATVAEASKPALNTWYHYAVVRSSGVVTIYRDGVNVGSATLAASITGTSTTYDNTPAIGVSSSHASHPNYYLNGYIDEFRISKGIARWTAAFTPPTRAYATFSAGDGVFTGELLTPRLGVGAFNTGSVDYELNVEGKGRFTNGLIAVNGITATGNFNLTGGGSTSLSGTLGVTGALTGTTASLIKTSSDAYTPTAYNNQSLLTLISPNANTEYSGIRFSNATGNYEKFLGSVQTGGATADIVFQGYDRGTTTYKEYFRIREDGNVGIGTTAPDSKLEIAGGSYNSSLKIKSSGAASGIQFEDSGGTTDGYVYAAGLSVGLLDAGTDWMIQCENDNFIRFATNGNTEHMRINSAGTVNIGSTSTSSSILSVYEATDHHNAAGKPSSTINVGAFALAANEGPTIDFNLRWSGGYQATSTTTGWIGGRIGSVYDTSSANGGALVFYTNHGASASGGPNSSQVTEKVRINPAGNVGIGTTGPATPLHVYSTDNDVLKIQGADHVRVLIDGTAASEKTLNFSDAGTLKWKIGMDNVAPVANFVIKTNDDGAPEFVIKTDGNVGIGTASPNYKLQVVGTFRASDTGYFAKTSGTGLSVDHGTSFGTIASDIHKFTGKVGIGTTATNNPLTVRAANAIIDAQSTADWQTIGFRAGYQASATLAGFFRYTTADAQLWIDNEYTGNNAVYSDINFRNKANGGSSLITRLKIKGSTGYVGIGTDSPDTLLNLQATAGADMLLLRTTGDTSGVLGVISFGNANLDKYMAQIRVTQDGATDSAQLQLQTQATGGGKLTRMTIKGDGKVGIGTTAPAHKLDVVSATASDWLTRLHNTSTTTPSGLLIQTDIAPAVNSGYLLGAVSAGVYKFVVQNNGNVGIGTVTPGNPLTVVNSTAAGTPTAWIHNSNNVAGADCLVVSSVSENDAEVFAVRSNTTTYSGGDTDFIVKLVSNSPRVGIGTTTPASTLHIRTSTNHNYEFEEVSGELRFSALNDARSANIPLQFAASEFNFVTGNVGIGTVAPGYNLEVAASSATWLSRIYNTHGGVGNGLLVRVDSTSSDAIFSTYSAGSHRFVVKGDGKVGIGTYTPYSLLEAKLAADPTSFANAGNTHLALGGAGTSDGYVTIGFGYVGGNSYRPAAITYKNTQNGGEQAGELGFWTRNDPSGSTVPTQRMVITDGGDVGIGTTAPATPLHVRKVGNPASGGNRSTVEEVLTLDATGYYPYTGYGVGVSFKGEDYGNTAIREYAKIQSVMTGYLSQTPAGDPSFKSALTFWTNTGGASGTLATEKVRIDNQGRVGIGIAAPIEKLQVVGQLISTGSNSTAATAGAERAIMDLSGYSATDHSARFGHFRGATAAGAGQLRLYTDSVERIRIDASGNVGIGTAAPSAKLHVAGDGLFDSLQTAYHFSKSFAASFANGTANLVGYISFGNSNPWGWIEVTLTGQYSHTNITGRYTKRFAIGRNADGGIYSQSSEVIANIGDIAGKFKIGAFETNTSTSLRLPIYSLTSLGNNVQIFVEGHVHAGSAAALIVSSLSCTTPVAVSNTETRDYFTMMASRVGIGTNSPFSQFHIKDATDANFTVSCGVASEVRLISINDADNDYKAMKFYGGRFEFLTGNVGIGTAAPSSLLEIRNTRAGSIDGGTGHTGSVLTLHTEAQWESSYSTGGANPDFLGSIDFSTGDSSAGEGVRAAIRSSVDSYYNSNSLTFHTRSGVNALAERMRIKPDGKVGIGTTAPSTPLYVVGTITASEGNIILNQADFGSKFAITSQGPLVGFLGGSPFFWAITYNSAGSAVVANSSFTHDSDGVLSIRHGSASTQFRPARLSIKTDGNVGIGTDAPGAKLEVGKNEAADNQIKITTGVWNEPTLFFHSYSNYNFTIGNFGTSGSKKFQLRANDNSVILSTGGDNSGNIGIGTAAPGAYKLYVNGSSYVNGALSTSLDINVAGDANVTGDIYADGTLNIHSATPTLKLYDADSDANSIQAELNGGNFRLYKYTGSGNNNHLEIFRLTTAGVVRINNSFNLPSADGSSGQVLQTNGSGDVTWQANSGSGGVTKYALTIEWGTDDQTDPSSTGVTFSGSGVNEVATVRHNLLTKDVVISIRDESNDFEDIGNYPVIRATTTSHVTLQYDTSTLPSQEDKVYITIIG